MQRIGLPKAVDYPRSFQLDFDTIKQTVHLSFNFKARERILEACRNFIMDSQGPTRAGLLSALQELKHKASRARRTRRAREEMVSALHALDVAVLSVLELNVRRFEDEMSNGTDAIDSLLLRIRKSIEQYKHSRRGREEYLEFRNLLRVLVEEYWKAGGKHHAVTRKDIANDHTNGSLTLRSGDIVDLVFEIVKQLKDRINEAQSNLLPALDSNFGRAVETALSFWYKQSDAFPAHLALWRERKHK